MNIETVQPKVEAWVKTVIGGVALMYAIGLLISNLFYSDYGFADFGLLRARYVMTGVSLLVFIALPLVVLSLPRLMAELVPVLFSSKLTAAALTAFLVLCGIYVVPMAFWRFIPFISRADEKSLLWGHLGVWSLYHFPTVIAAILFLWLPGTLLVYRSALRLRPPAKRILKLSILLGFFTLPDPFAKWVFPNIDQAAGGGQPELADVILKPGTGLRGLSGRPTTDSTVIRAMIWYRGEDMYFLSVLAEQSVRPRVIGLPVDDVAAVVFLNGYVRVETRMARFGSLNQQITVFLH